MDNKMIKKIRELIPGLTQKQMASVLGITQGTIARYESGAAKPSEDVENKLLQLQTILEDEKQAIEFKEILRRAGGLAVAAGILAVGVGLFSKSNIAVQGFRGLQSILGGEAGKSLFELLKIFQKKYDSIEYNFKPAIVQLPHPGPEHGHDKNNKNHKSWNTEGRHLRKFIQAKGKYVEGDDLKTGELMFWGEWEPPSDVIRLPDSKIKYLDEKYPVFLHKPYLPIPMPAPFPVGCGKNNIAGPRDTDPFVFDGPFKYFVCRQFRGGTNSLTRLSCLEPGSIIIFGSAAGKGKNAYFMLDTIFVVSDFIEYSSHDERLPEHPQITHDYNQAVFQRVFPRITCPEIKLRIYFGATFDNKIDGMYSFSPAKVYQNGTIGFPRVSLAGFSKYITNNLSQNFRYTESKKDEIINLWKNIRDISRNNGCVEGVEFEYERRKQ